MTPVSVTYDEHRAWGRPGYQRSGTYRYRPFEEVTIHGPMGSKRLWCLVDTGADRLQVHTSVAKRLGINLTRGKIKDVQLAGGGTSRVTQVAGINVEIEGQTYVADCLFGSNKTPILGRETILSAIDIGFDAKGWLLKLSAPQNALQVRVDNYKKERRTVTGRKLGLDVAVNAAANYNPPMSEFDKLLFSQKPSSEVQDYSFDLSIENMGKTHIEGRLKVEFVWLEEVDPDGEPEERGRWDITAGLAIPRGAHDDTQKRHYLSRVNLNPGDTDKLCSITITSPLRKVALRKAWFFQIKWTLDPRSMPSIEGKLDLAQMNTV
jgi:predicted aspartyl protease